MLVLPFGLNGHSKHVFSLTPNGINSNADSFGFKCWGFELEILLPPNAIEANGILFVVVSALKNYICHLTLKYLFKTNVQAV